MKQYDKINTLFKRDMGVGKKGKILDGYWTNPEFEYLANTQWIGTEKVDGTNTRILWNGSNVDFRGKTDDAQFYAGMLEMLKTKFTPDLLSSVFQMKDNEPLQVAIYGESYGKTIQSIGKSYAPDSVKFIGFDIKIGDWWLKREDAEKLFSAMNIHMVPVVFNGTLHEAIAFVKQEHKSIIAETPTRMEGLVLTPAVPLMDRKGDRIITKIKWKDFK